MVAEDKWLAQGLDLAVLEKGAEGGFKPETVGYLLAQSPHVQHHQHQLGSSPENILEYATNLVRETKRQAQASSVQPNLVEENELEN